ncbi:hypothetical protein ACIPW9_11140 [Streptomyces sp. NPDC090052]|uniref:hypothetical protein n=1 Tax=unclassified Streptomyces TaxID=2593676 RepID=UPI002251ABDA|nr:hypothetical protein [Streptomyces sp. NBC_01306]MCX4725719.1 hypothetical protein [Streptomyces sp. NBC_01306]WSX42988.1 hypothetical protein OG760_15470 [Streptomyces sp. NBC_00963]
MTTATATAARTSAPRTSAVRAPAAHPVRSAVRAVGAFASAAFSVMILGEHGRR